MRCWLPTVAFALAIAATPACRGTDGTNAQDPAATTANAVDVARALARSVRVK